MGSIPILGLVAGKILSILSIFFKDMFMSILPRTFIEGKRCFIYCGDERCNCDLSPYFHGKKSFLVINKPKESECSNGNTSDKHLSQ